MRNHENISVRPVGGSNQGKAKVSSSIQRAVKRKAKNEIAQPIPAKYRLTIFICFSTNITPAMIDATKLVYRAGGAERKFAPK